MRARSAHAQAARSRRGIARRRYRALGGRVRVLRHEARYAPRSRALVDRVTAGRASLAYRLRIYLTAARAEPVTPFVRIAAGTEHRLELDALTDVLATAIETSVSSPRRS